MKDHKTLELEQCPWQIALLEPWLRPLCIGEVVTSTGPYIRRALPSDKNTSIIEGYRSSRLWADEYIYEVASARGQDIYYAMPKGEAYRFFAKQFSKDSK